MKPKLQNIFYLFFPIVIGSIVGFLIQKGIDYSSLIQPPFAPPAILFPIVWSILYLLIGISYYLYRRENQSLSAMILYYSQLFFNFLWPIFFFLLKWRLFSIFWIILLVLQVGVLLVYFYRDEKRSFYLVLPYLIWLLYATYLNIGIYLCNYLL